MKQEKDTLFVMALISAGVIIVSGLAATKQWIVVIPVTIVAVFLTVLTTLQYRKGVIHLSETFERWAMILVLILFIYSFVVLYKPA